MLAPCLRNGDDEDRDHRDRCKREFVDGHRSDSTSRLAFIAVAARDGFGIAPSPSNK
jgi:hypothetical protein